jgi:hypothetical protein
LDPLQKGYWQDCREQRNRDAACQNDGENGQAWGHRGVKIDLPDPDGRPETDGETKR